MGRLLMTDPNNNDYQHTDAQEALAVQFPECSDCEGHGCEECKCIGIVDNPDYVDDIPTIPRNA
jgi:hypothetical protein